VHALICGELFRHLEETTLRLELIDVRDGVHLSSTEVELSLPFGTARQQQFADEISGKMRPSLEKLANNAV
jgi:hypothetical protein